MSAGPGWLASFQEELARAPSVVEPVDPYDILGVDLDEVPDDAVAFARAPGINHGDDDSWKVTISGFGPPYTAFVASSSRLPVAIVTQWDRPDVSLAEGCAFAYLVWYRGRFLIAIPRVGFDFEDYEHFKQHAPLLKAAVASDARWQEEVHRDAYDVMFDALPASEGKTLAMQLKARQQAEAAVRCLYDKLSVRFAAVELRITDVAADRVKFVADIYGPWQGRIDGQTVGSWPDVDSYRTFLYQQLVVARYLGRLPDGEWAFQVRGWTVQVQANGLAADEDESAVARWMEFVLVEREEFEQPLDEAATNSALMEFVVDNTDGLLATLADDPTYIWRGLLSAQRAAGGDVDEPKARQRRAIPQQVKREVWRRDDGRCADCGSNENLEYDHIIPFSRGGADTVRNLQLLCEPCNRRKSANV
jgi:hypothetical protein